jgi:hypothetical protein
MVKLLIIVWVEMNLGSKLDTVKSGQILLYVTLHKI